MRLSTFWLAFIWLAAAMPLAAQQPIAPRIEVGPNIRVSPETLEWPLTEPYVVAHPKNPKHLLAAAILASPKQGAYGDQVCVSFVSEDGGRTWSAPHSFGFGICADPWLALREDGAALFVGLEDGQIHVFRSGDAGHTWSEVPLPAGFGRAHDRPTLAVDASNGPYTGSFYLLSILAGRSPTKRNIVRVHLARSRDGGKTFDEPLLVQPSNLNLNTFTPAVLSDGTLLVSFGDFQSNVDDFRDKGRLERPRFWVLISEDGGKTLSPPLFVAEGCGGDVAADASSGPFHDRIYLVCTRRDLDGVWVLHSADHGERWSEPARVNTSGGDVVRRTKSLAVNNKGVVAVSWYQRPKGSQCQHIYFAASLDGGKTFLPEVRVSTAESCPDNPRNGRAAQRWPFGGDYSGLAASSDGLFHVLWADSRNGIYQLYTAAVKVTTPAENKP